MNRLLNTVILAFFISSFASLSCRPTPQDDPTQLANTSSDWRIIQSERIKKRDAYFAKHAEETQAFLQNPVGFHGLPAIVLALLADVMPDLWGAESLKDETGFISLLGSFPATLHDTPGSSWDLSVAVFSCASCHAGRILVENTAQWILGAPNNQIDVAGYRHKLWRTVNDPRFTSTAFRAALNQKKPGWLFEGKKLEIESKDTKRFISSTDEVLTKVKLQVNRYHDQIYAHLGQYTYKNSLSMLRGGVPGSIDAFGFTIALLVMPPFDRAQNPTEQAKIQREFLPPEPPMIDIMSVWQQSARKYSQWDGSIESKLIRNLGAELGAIGSPQWVNFENAKRLTPFVADMPAPPYPFDVDLDKAARGERIYRESCQHCHSHERFLEIELIGTDPNRARSLTAKSRAALIQALRLACSDPEVSDCRASDEQILRDRSTKPGYLALPHDGLWARAPYLHNGSVPTLYHLLVPSERPQRFKRGSVVYDQQRVGFDWQNDGIEVNTRTVGYTNTGHSDLDIFFGGRDFARDTQAREDLLEYLKTL